jgi:hypothetical protein
VVKPLHNPFPVTGYQGPAYFCDRDKESAQLVSAAQNGRNVTLIARRRIGKTSLLHHFAHQMGNMRPSWRLVYVDLIKTNSLRGLYELLAKVLFLEQKKSKSLPDLNLLGRLRMTLGMDPLTQLPQVSFDLKDDQVPESLHNLLDWLSSQPRLVIAFDEFQQILNYPDPNVEALMRSEMQRLPGIRFIYSGSDQHLLQEMFEHNSRPFYQSTEQLRLGPIESETYGRFIKEKFKQGKMVISAEALDYILRLTEGETFAVQRLCNALYEMAYPQITLPLAQDTLIRVLDQQQQGYEQIRALIGPNSNLFKVLKAMARLGVTSETYGKEILKASGIHNASSVNKAIQSLRRYGVVSQVIFANGEKGYVVDDALFRAWLTGLPD